MKASDDDILASFPKPPATVHLRDLLRQLGLPRTDRDALRDRVDALVERGDLERHRGRRYGRPPPSGELVGTLTLTGRGFGFVAVEGLVDDVYVDARDLGPAMHRDRVRLRLQSDGRGRSSGVVTDVVERGTHTFVATCRQGRRGTPVLHPQDDRLPDHVAVDPEGLEADDGDLVAATFVTWPDRRGEGATARIIKRFGLEGEAARETDIIVYDLGLPLGFSEATEAQVAAFPAHIPEAELARRTDLRARRLFTCDPESARDFDDAMHAEARPAGGWRFTVAIADVAHYVTAGSPLDDDARARGTSVYLPDRVLPMLPHRLSSDLCSLRPDEDRLAMVVEFDIEPDGTLGEAQVCEAVIRSHARFTYERMGRLLGIRGPDDAPQTDDDPTFEALRPVAEQLLHGTRALRAARRRRGYLELDLAEPRVLLDAEGKVDDVRPAPRHEAHKVVEEAMLAANEVIARQFVEADHPTIFRVHGDPSPDGLARFRLLADAFGAPLKGSSAPTAKQLSKYLRGIADHPQATVLNVLLLRAMARAEYEASDAPHFGLGAPHYLHFTSPIRRYPDLIVHRHIKTALTGGEGPDPVALDELARHCSRRERLAVDAERTVEALYKALFLAERVGEVFDGTISGLTASGMFVQLDDHAVDGFVHVEQLDDDYYELDDDGLRLMGRRKGGFYQLGDRLRIKVRDVNVRRRRVDFAIEKRLPRLGRGK
ncbi:MAG: ribonuclease R [Myxococcales bacterium]|nr:ribonuclease R [Myxococcales bacterium]